MFSGLRIALAQSTLVHYALHQLVGILIGAMCYTINLNSPYGYHQPPAMNLPSICFFGLLGLNVLCFPLARFMYDLVVQPVWDKFTPLVEGHVLNLSKLMAVLLCWSFAWLITPLGCYWLTPEKFEIYRAKRTNKPHSNSSE